MARPAHKNSPLAELRRRYPKYASFFKHIPPQNRAQFLFMDADAVRLIAEKHPSIAGRSQDLVEGGMIARGMPSRSPAIGNRTRERKYGNR